MKQIHALPMRPALFDNLMREVREEQKVERVEQTKKTNKSIVRFCERTQPLRAGDMSDDEVAEIRGDSELRGKTPGEIARERGLKPERVR